MHLKDKVVIVTGASRGIGAALALELARRSARVVCAARGSRASGGRARARPGTVEETAEQVRALGGTALAVPTDVADEQQIARLIDETARHFGRIDAVVNNAALMGSTSELSTPLADLDREWAVNLRGPLAAAQAAVPHLRRAGEGAILNVTSSVGLNVLPGMMMYGVTKLALERLTLDLAVQLSRDRIACNAFRIDLPVFEEDVLAWGGRFVDEYRDFSEPPAVAAQGICWMLEQPPSYTGRLEGMKALRAREGAACMSTLAKRPDFTPPGMTRASW